MRVLSPVGTFPIRLTGARVERDGPVIEAAMGAWRSEVRLERPTCHCWWQWARC